MVSPAPALFGKLILQQWGLIFLPFSIQFPFHLHCELTQFFFWLVAIIKVYQLDHN